MEFPFLDEIQQRVEQMPDPPVNISLKLPGVTGRKARKHAMLRALTPWLPEDREITCRAFRCLRLTLQRHHRDTLRSPVMELTSPVKLRGTEMPIPRNKSYYFINPIAVWRSLSIALNAAKFAS